MLNKKEFVEKYASAYGVSKAEAERQTDCVIEAIVGAAVNDGGVQFVGNFAIEVSERAERQGKNPRTGESITIPASKSLHIKTGKRVKDLLNN